MRALNRCLTLAAFALITVPAFGSNCNWNTTPSAVSFGTYSAFSTGAVATTTAFNFRCTPNTYARLQITRGSSGVYVPYRTMRLGANSANYNIYLDAAGSQVWGDTTAGSVTYDVYNSTPQNKDFADNMYGIMPAGQDLIAGTYTDTLTATLGYSNNPGGPFSPLAGVTITVTVTVPNECRVDAFTLDFGTYDPLSATALAQSTVLKVYCTRGGAPTSVTINNGSFALGTQKRMMSSGGVFLNYAAALGSTSGTSTSASVPINNGFTLSGTVAAGQDVAVGSYSDTLVASVNY